MKRLGDIHFHVGLQQDLGGIVAACTDGRGNAVGGLAGDRIGQSLDAAQKFRRVRREVFADAAHQQGALELRLNKAGSWDVRLYDCLITGDRVRCDWRIALRLGDFDGAARQFSAADPALGNEVFAAFLGRGGRDDVLFRRHEDMIILDLKAAQLTLVGVMISVGRRGELIFARRLGHIDVAAGWAVNLVKSDRAVVTLAAGGAAAHDTAVPTALGTELSMMTGVSDQLRPAVGVALLGVGKAADLALCPMTRAGIDKAAVAVIRRVEVLVRVEIVVILIG